MKRSLAAAMLGSVVLACSQAPDIAQTVLAFEQHKNNGNLDAALSLFADEPSLHFGPLGTITGYSEVRGILEYDVALNTHLRFEACETRALEVTCRVVETNNWLELADIEAVTYDENRFTFTSDGRIQSIAARMSTHSAEQLGEAMMQFDKWAREHRPTEYAELFSADGAFVYSHENAENVLALLRSWRSH